MRSVAAEVSTQVPRRARSVATLVSVHVHEPSRAYTIQNGTTAPPPTALKHPRGPGPTSLCHKSNIKLIFMFQNTTKQKHVRKIKMYRLSGAPSPGGTKNIPSSKCYEYRIPHHYIQAVANKFPS